jgi:hypothetical protein
VRLIAIIVFDELDALSPLEAFRSAGLQILQPWGADVDP